MNYREPDQLEDSRAVQGLLAVVPGMLLWAAFPSLGFDWLAWVALIPFFFLGELRGLLRPVLWSFLGGLVYFGLLTAWSRAFHPLAWPFLTFTCALAWPVTMLGYKIIRRRYLYWSFLLVPAWWVAVEQFRSTGYWGFPWGVVGYTQWQVMSLLQITSLTGIAGISFLVVLVNFTLFRLVQCRLLDNRVLMSTMVVVAVVVAALLLGHGVLPRTAVSGMTPGPAAAGTFRIALIQPNFPAKMTWETEARAYLDKLRDLTEQAVRAVAHAPDLVVWAETAIPIPLTQGADGIWRDPLLRYWPKITQGRFHLIVGRPVSITGSDGRVTDYNCAVLYNPAGEAVNYEGKEHLVPFGETMPFLHDFKFIEDFGVSVGISDYAPVPGKAPLPVPGGKFGVLICYESTFGDLTRRQVAAGSTMLLNMTNDVWSGSEEAHWQHYTMSVVRAAENRTPLVRVGNSGISAVINAWGHPQVESPVMREKVVVEDIAWRTGDPTFYTLHGDWFAWSCFGLAALVLLFQSARQLSRLRRRAAVLARRRRRREDDDDDDADIAEQDATADDDDAEPRHA